MLWEQLFYPLFFLIKQTFSLPSLQTSVRKKTQEREEKARPPLRNENGLTNSSTDGNFSDFSRLNFSSISFVKLNVDSYKTVVTDEKFSQFFS